MLLERCGTEALRKTDRKIYELVNRISPPFLSGEIYHQGTFNALRNADSEIYDLITDEYKSQLLADGQALIVHRLVHKPQQAH